MNELRDFSITIWLFVAMAIIFTATEIWEQINPARWLTSQERAWCVEQSSCETAACCREYFHDQSGQVRAD